MAGETVVGARRDEDDRVRTGVGQLNIAATGTTNERGNGLATSEVDRGAGTAGTEATAYNRHIVLPDLLVARLRQTLLRAGDQSQRTADGRCFQQLNKKQQNVLIMRMLGKINNQILKFNVKKLFQIWAIYHPEDVNCQIISQLMFKGPSAYNHITAIREELLRKNRKIRKNNVARRMAQKSPAGYNAALLGGEFCCLNGSFATLTAIDPTARRAAESAKRDATTTAEGGASESTTESTAAGRLPGNRRQRNDAFKIPAAANYQLFRSLDKRGLLQCARLFDINAYHVTDLPLLMCYTDYHVGKLIEVCRRSRSFPVHLLPRYLRNDVDTLLRL